MARGFYENQRVAPRKNHKEETAVTLCQIVRFGDGSFVAVMKTFGYHQSPGMLSFPRSGVTLALDSANRGERTLKLFEYLDAIVRDTGGRIYPAKDARMPRAVRGRLRGVERVSDLPRLQHWFCFVAPFYGGDFANKEIVIIVMRLPNKQLITSLPNGGDTFPRSA